MTFTLAVIYRWRVSPDCEDDFVAAWSELTKIIATRAGGLGSRLHRDEDGWLVAYAQWPDAATRNAATLEGDDVEELRAIMRRCILETDEEVLLEPIVDLLDPG